MLYQSSNVFHDDLLCKVFLFSDIFRFSVHFLIFSKLNLADYRIYFQDSCYFSQMFLGKGIEKDPRA